VTRKLEHASAETRDTIRRTAQWIEQAVSSPDGYRMSPGSQKTLLATCFGVLAHEVLGTLDTLSLEKRSTLAGVIKRQQVAKTGLFRDPLHPDSVLFRLKKFTPAYVEWQETYFALHALDALGEKPEHPLSFMDALRTRPALDGFLRGLSFQDFWFVSNPIMFLLFFLIAEEGERSPGAHFLLDLLDVRQDPETGFWGTDQGASLMNGMAGAFHLYGFYQYLDRPIAHQDRALSSTLQVQEPSGLFGERGGGPCEDLDAVDILSKLQPSSTALEREVRRGLERAMSGIRACRQADGGYSWSSPQRGVKPKNITYSGLTTLRTRTDQSDLWSAWFRPLALALARDRLGLTPAWNVRFRRLPLLGWHRPTK
jgi:hypothetical protein